MRCESNNKIESIREALYREIYCVYISLTIISRIPIPHKSARPIDGKSVTQLENPVVSGFRARAGRLTRDGGGPILLRGLGHIFHVSLTGDFSFASLYRIARARAPVPHTHIHALVIAAAGLRRSYLLRLACC